MEACKLIHPEQALFSAGESLPLMPVCEHYAGSQAFMTKAFAYQEKLGPVFDVTFDCEDGAPCGAEREHAQSGVELLLSPGNKYKRAGFRIHGPSTPFWRSELELVLKEAADTVAYITVPKVHGAGQVQEVIGFMKDCCERYSAKAVPLHVLIETRGALREVWDIAALPAVEVLDFGLLDFLSDHFGAIPLSALRSPDQFEHELIKRAKAEVAAAALGCSKIPSHNISTELRNEDQVFRDARRARDQFGFLRMWSIHPAQILPIVRGMTPDADTVAQASAVLPLAQERNWAPLEYDGQLFDRGSYRYLWSCLRRAKLAGASLREDIEQRFFIETGDK